MVHPPSRPLEGGLDYADRCWSKVLSNWATVQERGLTEHANWWPVIDRQARASWGIEPDRDVLAYAETSKGQRVDLKSSASGA